MYRILTGICAVANLTLNPATAQAEVAEAQPSAASGPVIAYSDVFGDLAFETQVVFSARRFPPQPPRVEEEEETGFSVQLAFVSDYRNRGVSMSGRGPAVQGGLDYLDKSGLFAGVWASSLKDQDGADAEVHLYGGYANTVGKLNYSLAATYGFFPGGTDMDIFEFEVALEHPLGPATLEGVFDFAPVQRNAPEAQYYASAGLTFPIGSSPISLTVRGGYETAGGDDKFDWETGFTYEKEGVSASLGLVGTNRGDEDEEGENAGTSVIAAVSLGF